VMVNNSTNINKNHLSPWYWWNCWPSLNELKIEVIFVDIGGIVDYHSMSWLMVNHSTNINKNHLSP
jgi:hypothetical protein